MKTIHVAAAVIHDEDRIFATQRGYGPWKDYWEFPGGKIEPGEAGEEAVCREIKEELDTDILIERKLTTVDYDYPEFHLTMECYIAKVISGSLVLKEHEAAKWLKRDELDTVNWLPADLAVVELIKTTQGRFPVAMIRTIIFDIGNVLMNFDYMPYVRALLKDEDLVYRVNGAIWRTGYWNRLDLGEETEKIFELMLAADPGCREEIRLTFENVGQCMKRLDYAIPWIKELKARGFRVLYLSNYSEYTMSVNPDVLDFLPYMDGGVFSCHVHLVKPDPAIYKKICDEYDLIPEECVFIDDNAENIHSASVFGFNTILFTDYHVAKKQLNNIIGTE